MYCLLLVTWKALQRHLAIRTCAHERIVFISSARATRTATDKCLLMPAAQTNYGKPYISTGKMRQSLVTSRGGKNLFWKVKCEFSPPHVRLSQLWSARYWSSTLVPMTQVEPQIADTVGEGVGGTIAAALSLSALGPTPKCSSLPTHASLPFQCRVIFHTVLEFHTIRPLIPTKNVHRQA